MDSLFHSVLRFVPRVCCSRQQHSTDHLCTDAVSSETKVLNSSGEICSKGPINAGCNTDREVRKRDPSLISLRHLIKVVSVVW